MGTLQIPFCEDMRLSKLRKAPAVRADGGGVEGPGMVMLVHISET